MLDAIALQSHQQFGYDDAVLLYRGVTLLPSDSLMDAGVTSVTELLLQKRMYYHFFSLKYMYGDVTKEKMR